MVVISGNLDNLQSSLDFFLSITSKTLVSDSKEMRDRFFDMFKKEDLYRKENFLLPQEKVSNDYEIIENTEPVLVGEEESYHFGSYSFADRGSTQEDGEVTVGGEEEYPSDEEVYSNEVTIEDEEEYPSYEEVYYDEVTVESEEEYLSDEEAYYDEGYTNEEGYECVSYDSLEGESITLDIKKDDVDSNYNYLEIKNNNLEVEQNDGDSNYSYLEIKNNNLEVEQNDGYSLSSYLEDGDNVLENQKDLIEKEKSSFDYKTLSSETEKTDLEIEDIELDDDEFINHSSSENKKVVLEIEDIELEDDEFVNHSSSENKKVVLDNENTESPSCGNFGSGVIEGDSRVVTYEVPDSIEGTIWNNFNEVDSSDSKPDRGTAEELIKEENEDFSIIEGYCNTINTEEVNEEGPKNIVVEVKKEVGEVIEVPKDLRDFVKLHHNCDMSFALKYFTKKEIDKQLSLGRVFKRKNRLLI